MATQPILCEEINRLQQIGPPEYHESSHKSYQWPVVLQLRVDIYLLGLKIFNYKIKTILRGETKGLKHIE